MSISLIYGSSIAIALFLVWNAASFLERNMRQRKYRVLEAQWQQSEAKAARLAEELGAARSQCLSLQRDLESGRQAQAEALNGLRLQSLKQMMRAGIATAAAGFFAGAVIVGIVVDARAQNAALRRSTDLEVRALVAEARFKDAHSELAVLRDEQRNFRKVLLEAREEKAVALTKLEILLGHFSGKKAKGVDLDVNAIRESLRRGGDEILSPQEILALSASGVR
ncbi:MAG TPA: hypothetical protein VL688_01525 [Verrucomicrobiae bacterium]|jgi:hypothetical protein|nr:hypothetical protein [Verrucomicrobiae bacterium]